LKHCRHLQNLEAEVYIKAENKILPANRIKWEPSRPRFISECSRSFVHHNEEMRIFGQKRRSAGSTIGTTYLSRLSLEVLIRGIVSPTPFTGLIPNASTPCASPRATQAQGISSMGTLDSNLDSSMDIVAHVFLVDHIYSTAGLAQVLFSTPGI
jgi:hypothetical protein